MAAPNSAQTRPSHRAKTAPKIQPSMACGPPAALTISGMVMNGPTPIMSIMFSVVAPASPTPRISSGWSGGLFGLMSHAQQVHVETDGSGYTERQLAEEGISGVQVVSLAILRQQQAAFLRRLARIVASQKWGEVRVPLIHEVQATLLHPAVKIVRRDLVWVMEHRALRIKDGDRHLFHGHTFAAELRWKRRVWSGVEIAWRSVVLHQQRAAVLRILKEPLIVFFHVIAGVAGLNAEHDRSKACQIAVFNVICRQQCHIQAKLSQNNRNVISSAHDITNLQPLRDLHLHHAGALQCGLVIEEAAEIGPGDQTVAFAVIAIAGVQQRAHLIPRLFRSIRQNFKFCGLFAGLAELDGGRRRFDLPSCRYFGMNRAVCASDG